MQLQPSLADATPQELQSIEVMTGILTEMDKGRALALLRQWGGNVERAMSASFDIDTPNPEPAQTTNWSNATENASGSWDARKKHNNSPARTDPPVIDLTADDEDISRAVQHSMVDRPTFGPSNRQPNANWSLVPVNSSISAEEQSYQQALQDSINTQAMEESDPLYEMSKREESAPIAVRPGSVTYAPLALIMQCLFSIWQVRRIVAMLDSLYQDKELEAEEPGVLIRTLIDLFAHLDLAQMASVDPEDLIAALSGPSDVEPWTMRDKPGLRSSQLLHTIFRIIEDYSTRDLQRSRTFQFTFVQTDSESKVTRQSDEIAIIHVTSGATGPSNDLLSRLKQEMPPGGAIGNPSEVLVFHVKTDSDHQSAPDTAPKPLPQPFKFPSSFYLDQFYYPNRELVHQSQLKQIQIAEKLAQVEERKKRLTIVDGNDALANLRASIYYYDFVADRQDPKRKEMIEATSSLLKSTLSKIESEVSALNDERQQLEKEFNETYNIPELCKLRYDLRAVIVHNGLYGRKNIYSYVQANGTWWKTVDHQVMKVTEEEVLNDSAGLHYSAGPFLLFYSAAYPESGIVDEPLPWSSQSKHKVLQDNTTFINNLESRAQGGKSEEPDASMEIRDVTMSDFEPPF